MPLRLPQTPIHDPLESRNPAHPSGARVTLAVGKVSTGVGAATLPARA